MGRQKCPPAPPADMPKEATKRPIRKKRVARLPSPSMLQGPRATSAAMHETTQRPWTASSASDGLRSLREVVEPNYVHKHHKVPLTSIDLGIQCRIPPEIIIPTDNDDFVVSSFVPTGRTLNAV